MSATKHTIYTFRKHYLCCSLHLFKEDIPQCPVGWDSHNRILKLTAKQQLSSTLYHMQSWATVPSDELMQATKSHLSANVVYHI